MVALLVDAEMHILSYFERLWCERLWDISVENFGFEHSLSQLEIIWEATVPSAIHFHHSYLLESGCLEDEAMGDRS